jgi:hypothetical protein
VSLLGKLEGCGGHTRLRKVAIIRTIQKDVQVFIFARGGRASLPFTIRFLFVLFVFVLVSRCKCFVEKWLRVGWLGKEREMERPQVTTNSLKVNEMGHSQMLK